MATLGGTSTITRVILNRDHAIHLQPEVSTIHRNEGVCLIAKEYLMVVSLVVAML